MARTIDYLPFSISVGANVEGQSSYVVDPIRLTGHQAGVARSAVMNKTLRQQSVMVAALANMLSEALDVDVLDDGDVDALKLMLQDVILGGRATILTADTTFYVRTGGSDANDGLSPSTAWATVQHAYDELYERHNLNGFVATIDVGAGTFDTYFSTSPLVGQATEWTLYVTGAGRGSTTLDGTGTGNAIDLSTGAEAVFTGLKLIGGGDDWAEGNCVHMWGNATASLIDIDFSTTNPSNPFFAGGHIMCDAGSTLEVGDALSNTSCAISDDAGFFAWSALGSSVLLWNCAFALSGTPAFSNAFVLSQTNSTLNCANVSGYNLTSFSGLASGRKFIVDGTSTIRTAAGAGDANFFPGNVAGTWVNSNAQQNYL